MRERRRSALGIFVFNAFVAFIAPPVGAERDRAPSREAVERFVCQRYIHGIPYAEAARFAGALPRLKAILADASKKGTCWENTIAVIAAIGAPESYEILRSFIWDRFRGPVDSPTYDALEAAVATMGFASPGQPRKVVQCLEEGADPRYWSRLPWVYPKAGRPRTERQFSLFSIGGLGFCSDPTARSALLRLEKHPYSEYQRATIRSSLTTQEKVARLGLRAYQQSKTKW